MDRTRDALLLFIVLLLILVSASRNFGLTWDETIYFDFSDSIKGWFNLGPSFDEADLNRFWAYDKFANPHPPFMKILSAITSFIDLPLLGFPVNYRLGHYVFISFSLTVVFLLLGSVFGRAASLWAISFIFLQPRLFGHLLNGGVDSPSAMGWLVISVLSWRIVKDRGVRPGLKEALFCMMLSFTAATKFTALLVVIPVTGYFLFRRCYRGVVLSAAAFITSLVFLVIVSPEKWHHPFHGIIEYLLYPFTRESIPIETFYFGKTYPFFLPWHYFDVMTFFTFPVVLWIPLSGLLLLRKKESAFLSALLFPVLFWLVLGHYRGTPKHDVVRQFISLFPLLGLLSWYSLFLVSEYLSERREIFLRRMARFLPAVFAAALGLTLFNAHPFELSYYNGFAGGLKGAEKKGLEISYYLEAVKPDVLAYMNENIPYRATLTIYPPWTALLRLYKSKGLLRRDINIATQESGKRADYAIVVRRRAVLDDLEYKRLPALFETMHEGVSLLKLVALHR